ncbi:DNA repair protein RecN [Olivibacter sitiensis]|uniref:DNA repair protein RecN n=1 Tax=Olivibacter sitiensis TaxID=376470 RepID=UPI00042415EF|nr:DNA repair protein RecN [Olivibacter sitiensis]
MLKRLSIHNYALIDQLEIEPSAGLNILTGETGAGKSIVLGALSLILGQRAESKYFFNQAKKCIIEGRFDIGHYDLKDFFDEQELDYENETILRREISADGKSRAFINDTPVTLNQLKSLGEKLIDIHSQHATQELNTESFQLLTLDSVAQNGVLLQDYKSHFSQYKQVQKALQQLREQVQQAKTEADYHQFLYNELEAAKLQADEQVPLEQEQQQLSHAEEIKRALLEGAYALGEQEESALSLMRSALHQLRQIEPYLPLAPELAERLNSSIIEVKDIADEMSRLESGTLFDQQRLEEVSERLSLIYNLQQKHHVDDVSHLLSIQQELSEKLGAITDNEEELTHLETESSRLYAKCEELALQLSEARKNSIAKVSEFILDTLAEVGMPNSQLHIELTYSDDLRPTGRDHVRFLFSANKGQQAQPLNKVASGGELSRLMLAIKALVANTSALPTIIFDEIDTGISGEVALKVGDVMEKMAQHMQVIAITHLPQIAAKGTTHYKVYKEDREEKTLTNMKVLAQKERILEIAQMLSGSNPGDAAIQHAKELLE